MANLFLDVAAGSVYGISLLPAALTTSADGAGVDLVQSNGNMACALLSIGETTGDTPVIAAKVQESSAPASGFADVPGAAFATATTAGIQIISYQRRRRYVRVVATITGVTSTVLAASVFAPAAVAPSGAGGWSTDPPLTPGAPTLTSVTVAANGTTVTMVWSEPVVVAGSAGAVTSSPGGGALAYSSGSGSATVVFSAPTIYTGYLAALGVPTGFVRSVASGNPSALISNRIVTNNSTQDGTAPTLTTATVAANGTTFTLAFDEAVTGFASGAEGFTITPDGGAATVAYASGDGTATIIMTVNRTISTGETITLDYTPGDIADLAANLLAAIVAGSVTNDSAQP